MLGSRLSLKFARGVKQNLCTNLQQNVRWATAVSAGFNDSELAAAKPYQEIPSLTILPILGTAWAYMPIIGRYDIRRMGDAFMDKRKRLGDIFREKFGNFEIVFSFNPDDLQTIYKHEGPYPVRVEMESIKAYRESRRQWFPTLGLPLVDGKEWWDFRVKTQKHLMKPRSIQAFLNPMQDVARDLVKKMLVVRDANKEVPDLLGELYKWGLESVALVGLDTRLGCLDINLSPDSDGMKMINCIQTSMECMNKLEAFTGNLQWWKLFRTPTWKKLEQSVDLFMEISFKYINRSVEKLKNASEDQELTLLQSFLMTKGMDPSHAMVMVSDMMMAGIDTTGNSIGFFLYHMAKNPDKQELLYEDLKKILPRKEDRISPSIFNELKYLKACLKESQRLNPVAGFQVRVLDQDIVLSGYKVPAKVPVSVVIQGIFRDEKYFSSPDKFLPERWFEKDEKFHPYAFLPFGFGVRSCVGRRLAELEMICVASEILRNFKVEYHHEDIGVYTRMVNVPDKPLRLNFIER